MTTTFYVSWSIKKSNRVLCWYASKEVNTEEEARAKYEAKMKDGKVRDMTLWKKDTYKPDELEHWTHPYDCIDFRALCTYSR